MLKVVFTATLIILQMDFHVARPMSREISNAFNMKVKLNMKAHEKERNKLIDTEERLLTGGHLELNANEHLVNEIFMEYKLSELSEGMKDESKLATHVHFFRGKPIVEQSKVFKFIQSMPKGGILHVHNAASVTSEWFIRNLTYMQGFLTCKDQNNIVKFTFRRNKTLHGCQGDYTVIETERNKATDVQKFDEDLEKHINLLFHRSNLEYGTTFVAWKIFQNMFGTLGDALRYIPAYKALHWRLMEEMMEDNIMYAELRMLPTELYDEKGTVLDSEESVNILLDLSKSFAHTHSNFMGLRFIYSERRWISAEEIRKSMDSFIKWHHKYDDFIIGFDLVGEEEKGIPIFNVIDTLKKLPKTANYFFHAGETNWFGTTTDGNLVDAILLNTLRIGHGLALIKHPQLIQAVKNKDIAIEVSPISNQLLGYTKDLRNHPASFFLSQNIPVVISNDDPTLFSSKGLSYDFYYAIMSIAPSYAGLKTLKQLVFNSIKYSGLCANQKRFGNEKLKKQWDRFIENSLKNNAG